MIYVSQENQGHQYNVVRGLCKERDGLGFYFCPGSSNCIREKFTASLGTPSLFTTFRVQAGFARLFMIRAGWLMMIK